MLLCVKKDLIKLLTKISKPMREALVTSVSDGIPFLESGMYTLAGST